MWRTTNAAFTATTSNAGNSWTTGSVDLTDDDAGAALFTASGLTPGSTGSRCLTVTYTGTVATAVEVYASASTDPDAIAQYLDITIQEGSGGGFGSCTGFVPSSTIFTGTLNTFVTTHTGYASGVGAWAPSGNGSRVYRISYTLNAGTPNSAEGGTATATFQWEAQA